MLRKYPQSWHLKAKFYLAGADKKRLLVNCYNINMLQFEIDLMSSDVGGVLARCNGEAGVVEKKIAFGLDFCPNKLYIRI